MMCRCLTTQLEDKLNRKNYYVLYELKNYVGVPWEWNKTQKATRTQAVCWSRWKPPAISICKAGGGFKEVVERREPPIQRWLGRTRKGLCGGPDIPTQGVGPVPFHGELRCQAKS